MTLVIRRKCYKIRSWVKRTINSVHMSKRTRKHIMRKVKKILRKYKMIIKR